MSEMDSDEIADAVAQLRDWASAYPIDVFPELPQEKRAKGPAAAQIMRDMACPQFAADADFIESLAAQRDDAHAEVARLREALEARNDPAPEGHGVVDGETWTSLLTEVQRFVGHLGGCAGGGYSDGALPCDCGLADMLRHIEAALNPPPPSPGP